MHTKHSRTSEFLRLSVVAVGTLLGFLMIQPEVLGQSDQYERFPQEQKRLFIGYARKQYPAEFRRKTPAAVFAALPISERSTFAAVTNALANTELTGPTGESLRYAIGLVREIVLIAGLRAGKGTDEQFRLYVLLERRTVSVLESSREFKRGRDNTRYHRGYPISYRQQGFTPTLQFSISKDGERADIDIDYRSSGFPASLFNGHLKAANSDVRSPGNYFTHVLRWPGLIDFWRGGLKQAFEDFERSSLLSLERRFLDFEATRSTEAEKVEAAANEFLRLWLIRREPNRAVNFVSGKMLTCPAPVIAATDNDFEKRLRILFYNLLKVANKRLGSRKELEGVIEPRDRKETWLTTLKPSKPSPYDFGKVESGGERSFVCDSNGRSQQTGNTSGKNFYVTTFRFRSKDNTGGALSLLWTLDEGLWRITAFDAFAKQ